MRILIITRSFMPDSSIAAVRPTMFAKHLTRLGNSVTVIRSGDIFTTPTDVFHFDKKQIKVYSFEGENSAAERFERGEGLETSSQNIPKQKIASGVPKKIKYLAHVVFDVFKMKKQDKQIEEKVLSICRDKLSDHAFDVVISTYPPYGDHLAGKAASRLFNCKWVSDFRDLMDVQAATPILRLYYRRCQNDVMDHADAVLVMSKGSQEVMYETYKKARGSELKTPIHMIPNGYIETDNQNNIKTNKDSHCLYFCYTGVLDGVSRDFNRLFAAFYAMKADMQKEIKVICAGKCFEQMTKDAEEYGLSSLLEYRGVVSRTEATNIQLYSDIFLVATHNTSYEKGIMSGKIYEAFKTRKPIVAIVRGDVPNCELRQLIEKYRLGVCYEEADHDNTYPKLCEYIKMQHERKRRGEAVFYEPDESVFELFRYDKIVERLNKVLIDTVEVQGE